MNFIYVKCDSHKCKISSDVFNQYQYFRELISQFPNGGTYDDPYYLDIDKSSLKHLVECARYMDDYDYPKSELSVYNLFQSKSVVRNEDFIKVNVGDHIYYTTNATLSRSVYFNNILNRFDKRGLPDYIDRKGKAFRHILRYLRNTDYRIPEKYLYEEPFYGLFPHSLTSQIMVNDLQPIVNTENEIPVLTSPVENFLTTNPQITFYKAVYRRHTKVKLISRTIVGTNNETIIDHYISKDDKTITISNGTTFLAADSIDIINKMYLHLTLPEELKETHQCSLEDIDRIEFVFTNNLAKGDMTIVEEYNSIDIIKMQMDLFDNYSKAKYEKYLNKNELYIPIYFWCDDPSLSLPLIALKNTKINVRLILKSNIKYVSKLICYGSHQDDEERQRFKDREHEYLTVCKLDYISDFTSNLVDVKIPCYANIRFILFKIIPKDAKHYEQSDHLINGHLYIDGHFHSAIDPLISDNNFKNFVFNKYPYTTNIDTNGYYVIPFCLNALVHQPSGSESVTNNLHLRLLTNCKEGKLVVIVFVNNVIRIMSGFLGSAYINILGDAEKVEETVKKQLEPDFTGPRIAN